MNLLFIKKLTIILSTTFIVTACGGGGGGSSDTSEQTPTVNDPVVNDPVVNDPVVNDPVVNDPVVSSGLTTKDGSFDLSIIWAHGKTFKSDVTLRTLIDVAVNPTGKIALSGTTSPVGGGGSTWAIMSGMPDSLEFVIREGDSFHNQPEGIKFKSASNLRITNDGYVGFSADIEGAVDGEAYAMQTENGVELIAFTDGTTVTGLDGIDYTVISVEQGFPTSTVVALRTRESALRSVFLWLWENGEFTPVIGSNQTTIPNPIVDDCKVALPSGRSSFFVRDNKDLYFLAQQEFARGRGCNAYNTIIRYRDGNYETIVSGGETAPGFPSEQISAIKNLRHVPGVGIFFYAEVEPVGSTTFSTDEKETFWLYRFDGTFDLLAVEGQSFDYPIGNGTVQGIGDSEFEAFDIDRLANEWALGLQVGSSGYAALGGSTNQNESLSDLRNPTDLQLDQLMTAADTVTGFDDERTHNEFTDVEAIGNGSFIVSTNVGSPSSRRGTSTRWLISEGTVSELYREGDVLTESGVDYVVGETFDRTIEGEVFGFISDQGSITSTSDGTIFSTINMGATNFRVLNGLIMLKRRNQ